MGLEGVERRLAAHVQDVAAPPEPVEEAKADEDTEPFTTVPELLNFTQGRSDITVIGLKRLGALVEDGDWFIYTLHSPIEFPKTEKLRLKRTITGELFRKMRSFGENDADGERRPFNDVILSWVAALSGKDTEFVNKLGAVDCSALISVAQWIDADQGNR